MGDSVYIIVPAYNEAEVIRETILSLLGKKYNIVIVDDASSDDTYGKIKDLPVYYLRHRINLGQGAALQTGIDFAEKKGAIFFVSFDADGQHDANDIEGMIRQLKEQEKDIIFGSRFLTGASSNITGIRKIILKAGRWMNYLFTGILLTDAHNGLRVFNRKAAKIIRLRENRMAHASEFLLQAKKNLLRFAEHPVHIRYSEYSRKKGQSLLNSIRIFLELLLNKIFD
jgi:glycosyltransferase involved in cell wall biosynthesis